MYLKNIEVQGFKSFANKINFEFHNGITGIVGPNGSGKSNVADAVRWVLGEQRIKQLRGAKMEDVIFAGTEKRKPLGFAYVAITLDNSDHKLAIDYEEVTVSRRIYRSGESEYMINGSVCRLKDVNELFYDTGIGKEGYSIIGQGQIDKILSGKPEERRELFDEAAGIVKFKRRKAEAQKKLENERNNLTRIIDILSELEKQVKPLERQSETARTYLKLRDELKNYDINMFLLEITAIKEQLDDIIRKTDIVEGDISGNNNALEAAKSEYEKLDQFIEELNSNLDSKKDELNQTNVMKEKLEGEIKVLNEQINSAKINDEHINSRVVAISNDIDKHNAEKEELIKNRNGILEEVSKAGEIKGEADEKVNAITFKINELSEKVENCKNEIIELLNEKSNVKAKIQRYDTMLEQTNIRKAEIAQRVLKYKTDEEAQVTIINELEEEFKKINSEIIDNSTRSTEIDNKIKNINEENRNYQKDLDIKQQQFHRDNSKLEALRNMTERYEGYGNSIKKIMELKENKKGIIGVVADIIKTDKKYETAIETALGGSIQNVVTDTDKTAKEVIEYLKKNRFGRATFLPLSNIANKTGFTNERALSENGVIGLACDLVKVDKGCEAIAKYLLGRVMVVDNVDNAMIIARKYNYSLRIVTLEGELLNAGGSMSGGAFANSSNLLGRRREIEDLEQSIQNIKLSLFDIRKSMDKNKTEIAALNEELEKVKLVLNEQYILQNTVKMNLNQAGQKKKEIEEYYADFDKEKEQIAIQLKDISNNNTELSDMLTSFESRNSELEAKIGELNQLIEEEKENEAKELKNNENSRLELANLNQKCSFINDNISRIINETEKLTEELNSINENAANSSKEIADKQKDIAEIEKSLIAASEHVKDVENQIIKLNEEKETQTKEHKDFFSKREEISTRLTELNKELFRLNNQKEKLEESNDKQINYMWDEYELTFSAAKDMRDENLTNLPQIKKTIASLKSEIRELGDVNINAIEEYKNVSERYIFLKTQHDDLVTAENTLMKIIDELDAGMRKQFTEKFSEIRAEFDIVFKEMFGGGKGSIELQDDSDDILEAGITIVSQPPGKKLQNMMQLSGGEKALTAIALLFAIQNLKPSPFCLLDEIEAALDDSNVVRFAGYLHKLTEHTQFIVITHRRGTMASADRLYGITMQEKGISTLVSVNLIEEQLDK